MYNSYIFPLSITVLFFLPFVSAQEQPAKKINLKEVYDLAPILPFSSPAVQPLADNHIIFNTKHFGKQLLVKAVIKPDWHLYSVTQPDDGAIRSEFNFDSPDNELLEIKPDKAPEEVKAVGFNVLLEEHSGTVRWLLTFKENIKAGDVSRLTGNLYCQLCMNGPEGVCLSPKDFPFEAEAVSETEFTELTKSFPEVSSKFIWRKDSSPNNPSFPFPIPPIAHHILHQELTPVGSSATALLYAFLGGFILNFMPCVLPVIGLKILSFFEQAGKSRSRALLLNVSYSCGLLSVFLILAFLSYGLSIFFTFDIFNIIMVCIVFMMALSLAGVWELPVPSFLGRGKAEALTHQEGITGAFFKGIITTLLAIPCGAPLLSPAVNWADMQIRCGNTPLVFLAYTVIGLGMASPYLIMGAFPELLRFLPKPGQWMETFRKTMGFFLLIAVVWILYFIQIERLLPTVALLFVLWYACWKHGSIDSGRTTVPAKITTFFIFLAVIFFSFDISVNKYTLENAMRTKIYGHTGKHWHLYEPDALADALQSSKPVLVDFTADWCVNCKVLEQFILYSDDVLKKLDEKQAITFTADCTKEGAAKEFLREFGADQVPVLVVFNPKELGKPLVIRGGYTKNTLLDILGRLP